MGDDVARRIVGEECFAAIADPFHRPPDAARRPDHGDLLGIEIETRSEGAADIRTDRAHALRRHLETAGHVVAQAMGALASRDQGVALTVVAADRRARLHEGAERALAADGLLHHQVGARERGLDRGAIAECIVEREIARRLRPQRRRAIGERFLDAGDRRQHAVLDRDRLGAIARSGERLRHHHRHHLADIAHTADRKRKLVEVENFAFRRRRKGGNLDVVGIRRVGMMRDTDVAVGDIVRSGKDRQDARLAKRRRGVDRDDVGVSVRRAHERRERLPLDRHVVGIAALPAHEPQILEARQGSADERTAPRNPLRRGVVNRVHSASPYFLFETVASLSERTRHCQLAAPVG